MRRTEVIADSAIVLYTVAVSFLFALTVTETILLYPNAFRDVPASLVLTEQFMATVGVGDVVRPFGGVLVVLGVVATVAAWWTRRARGWVLASFGSLVLGQGIFSMLYQWPQVTVMFDERERHTAAELQRAATEFQIGQVIRVAFAAATTVLAIIAALRCYSNHILVATEAGAAGK
ncbi:hypothetical protein [Nocardia sp. NPDC003963]